MTIPVAVPIVSSAGESKSNITRLGTSVYISEVKEVGFKHRQTRTVYFVRLEGIRDPWKKRNGNKMKKETNPDGSFNLVVQRTFTE